MDNLTHSLVGIAFARTLRKRSAGDASVDEGGSVAAAVWASNLADLDSFTWLFGGKLVYLLQHRGYSHTLAAAPLIALASVGLAALGRKRVRRDRSWLRKTFGVALGAAVLHVVADSLNDYGVHPFWPLSNRWLYGDSVFIFEPLLLGALLPFAVRSAATRAARVILSGLGALVLGFLWTQALVPLPVAALVTLLSAIMVAWQWRAPRVGLAWAAVAAVIAVFVAGHVQARAVLLSSLPGGDTPLVVSTTAAPADPFCWRGAVASLSADAQYRVRVGVVSLAPWLVSRRTCDRFHRVHGLPPRLSAADEDPGAPLWSAGFEGSLASLQALRAGDCRFAAFLHWARVPFFNASQIGDLRYDSGVPNDEEGSFSTLSLAGEPRCPAVPAWEPPFDAAFLAR